MDPLAVALATKAGVGRSRADPLAFRRISSDEIYQAINWLAAGTEVYVHAGNAAGKTEGIADFFVRCCRGQTVMDGRLMTRPGDEPDPQDEIERWIRLPGFQNGEAWRQWVLVQSYAQAKDSSMRAYRKLLGDHPHEIGWIEKDKGTIKLIRVRPDDPNWSDDPESWSEITFISLENMTDEDVRTVQGARVHGVHGDEMPKQSVWREIRARRDKNINLYKAITATPEYKPEWEWCLEDFRNCFFSPAAGRVRVQLSVEKNRALSHEDLEKRRLDYVGDELFEARWNGEHVDAKGKNPFPKKTIEKMLAQCVDGRMERFEVRGEPKNPWEEDYRDILPSIVYFERWFNVEPEHSYVGILDTSRGIDTPDHDPAEFEVWDWTEPMLVARYGMKRGVGGYLDEDSLAILANFLGREYNNALLDVEVGGNYGTQAILTLRKLRYPNLAHDDRAIAPGVIQDEYGWTPNPTTNGEIVNAIIKGLNEDTFLCFSQDVLQQWLDVREDASGRPSNVRRGARHHREAMICAGRALHWIQTRPAPRIMRAREKMGMHALLRREFGRRVNFPGKKPGGRREIFRQDT